ncbi:MAG TPA: helix-turn-helix transcriptional regulator [Stellaceae bacterium]|nr:helix-turn-helix transcriptional regulator [Stellaceae bacterium]
MPGSGTRTFLEPGHYEAGLRQALIETVITPCGRFKARLTWAELHHLQLLRCEEELPRIAYLSLAPAPVFVAFSTDSGPLPVWRGRQWQTGEIMLRSRGERLHQATAGPSTWNVIALAPVELEKYGRALWETPLTPPPVGRVLRPAARDTARLRRLHAQTCRLAEPKPKMLAHPEVARAIEQGLIQALVTCLVAAKIQADSAAKRHHARIMIRFEEALAQYLGRPLPMPELSELIGVTDRTLRACCAEFLGISPSRYLQLRRLKQVRVALRDADPLRTNVAEVARAYGVTEMARFAEAYRAAFGETPAATLQRAAGMHFVGR